MTKRAVTAGKMIFLAMAMAGLMLFSGCENPTNSTGDDTGVSSGDKTAPTVGKDGELSFSGVSTASVVIDWTAAADDTSTEAALEYLLYRFLSDNIASVTYAETNDTPVGSYAANITYKMAGSLNSSTTYYFTVVVKDEAGNKAAYTMNSQQTTAPPFIM